MGRRRSSEPEPQTPAICQRMEWLLANVFENSITVMAKAMKVSHTALSRVLNKGQMPTGKMLVGLAKLGRINLEWLLVDNQRVAWSDVRTSPTSAPISRQLLVEQPSRVPEKLILKRLPVASPFLLHDPYWYQVPSESELDSINGSKIFADDFLLIETAPAWTSRSEAWVGRMVVLRNVSEQDGIFAKVKSLPRKDRDDNILGYPVEIIGDRRANFRLPGIYTMVPTTEEKSPRPLSFRYTVSDVVGVVLEVRRLLRLRNGIMNLIRSIKIHPY